MKLKIKLNNYIMVNAELFMLILLSYILFSNNEFYIIYVQSVLTLISIIIMILHIGKIYGNILNFHSLVIMSFYVFFLGRQLTALFGFNSYQTINYGGSYTVPDYSHAFFFSYCCICVFYAFSTLSYTPKREICRKEVNEIKLYKALQIVFGVCIIPMVYYYYTLITSALVSKYGSDTYDSLISRSGYLISLLREWGVLALIGIISLRFISKNKISVVYLAVYFGLTIVSLFSGGRTEGMSLLLILMLLYSEKNKGFQKKQVLALLGILLVSILAPYLFAIRKDITQIGTIRVSSFVNSASVLSAIHEMGGTASPFLLVRKIGKHIYGQSYLLAVINTIFNFLPGSIRPDFSFIGPASLAHDFTLQLGLNYGLGFNLVAESYYNFGIFGIFVFAFGGGMFRSIISRGNTTLSFIEKVLFVFLLFTMARRESKDLFTSILYYWIPFALLIRWIGKRNNNEIEKE